MLAAMYDQPGEPEVLYVRDVSTPSPGAGEVLIRHRAVAIEGGDLINRALTPPDAAGSPLGYSAAGDIVAVGENVEHLKVGDRVSSFGSAGSHAELRCLPIQQVWVLPENLSYDKAAALTIPFGTADHSLFAVGGLSESQTVLIQAGAGAVGFASIQLARQAGAHVITTVGGIDRAQQLRNAGAHHVIDYTNSNVIQAVTELTDGRGVDLVIDPVGSTLQNSIGSLAAGGHLVFNGNAGGTPLQVDLWPALQGNIRLSGVFMGTQFAQTAVRHRITSMLHRAAKSAITVPIDRHFALTDVVTAHHYAQARKSIGRVILRP
ncbi:NADPH:quinone reductase [Brevibacterium sandarakinum]|uniref:NADPH:quinone reductase n=2 Tax=Brevibacterium sandarakinum TaxID=629680 RepID=A0A1H1XGK0_BRESA|nr:NADPH:quinone reductase [Brevibacterium sandarakinum]